MLSNVFDSLGLSKKYGVSQLQKASALGSKLNSVIGNLSHYSKLVETIRQKELPYLNSISRLYKNLDNITPKYIPLSIGEALQQVQREFELCKDENDKDIVSFAQHIEDKAVKVPKNFLSAEFYISIIFALILFLLSQNATYDSEQNLTKKVQHLEELITELPHTLMPSKDSSTYYVVLNFVHLRQKPSSKSTSLEMLYPNLKVKLLERKGRWIQIQYYDHAINEFKTGWVYKKYLKILNRKIT